MVLERVRKILGRMVDFLVGLKKFKIRLPHTLPFWVIMLVVIYILLIMPTRKMIHLLGGISIIIGKALMQIRIRQTA